MEIETKRLKDLSAAELKRCGILTFDKGRWQTEEYLYDGYMFPMLHKYRNNPDAKAILLRNKRCIVGWAMLLPTAALDLHWEVSPYAKKRCKYAVQMFVGECWRNRGYGKMLMDEAMKHDERPFVYSHDERSGALYGNYKVSTLGHYRGNLRKPKHLTAPAR